MAKKLRYVVVDPETNSIVLERGAREHAHPASLTKMMTLAMVSEALALKSTDFNIDETKVKIPSSDNFTKGPLKRLAQFETLKPGKFYPANLLLAASGNKSEARSTVALAHWLAEKSVYGWGGNEKQRDTNFLAHMNRRLEEIGLTDTDAHVTTGWYSKKHHTTALDIAILADYMHSNFPKTTEHTFGQASPKIVRAYTANPAAAPLHSSRIIRKKPEEVLWAKTGYLKKHGFSQAVYYEKDGKPLIAVVLGSQTKSRNNTKVLKVISDAYKKLEDPSYTPKKVYEDVTFNPDAQQPTATTTGQSITAPTKTPEVKNTAAPISAPEIALPKIDSPEITDAEPTDIPEGLTTDSAYDFLVTKRKGLPPLPKTADGYPDLTKIPLNRLPFPKPAPDRTIRFLLCDAPHPKAPAATATGAPHLSKVFNAKDTTTAKRHPQTDEEMFEAVFNESFRKKMIHEEGYSPRVYRDSLGLPTVGIGHLLKGKNDHLLQGRKLNIGDQISDVCVDRLFKEDTSKAINAAMAQARDFNIFEPDFVTGLVSINYQLGTKWPKEWPNAYKQLKEGNLAEAMIEFIASDNRKKTSSWIKQTPYRVLNALGMIANEISERKTSAQDIISAQSNKIKELRATIEELTQNNTRMPTGADLMRAPPTIGKSI